MRIDALFAILPLLFCAIVAYADKPIMIKESEAIQYVGKEVEVRGRVVSVTTSPLGTTLINFGGEYPNQKFAGYITAGSKVMSRKRLTMLPGKTVSITGSIELYQGKPEINIIRADQIKVLDSQAEGGGIILQMCAFFEAVERIPTAVANRKSSTLSPYSEELLPKVTLIALSKASWNELKRWGRSSLGLQKSAPGRQMAARQEGAWR